MEKNTSIHKFNKATSFGDILSKAIKQRRDNSSAFAEDEVSYDEEEDEEEEKALETNQSQSNVINELLFEIRGMRKEMRWMSNKIERLEDKLN